MNGKIEALVEKIQKAKEAVAKKEITIAKKTALIEKKTVLLSKATDEHEARWIQCEIDSLTDDIARLRKEINAKTETIAKHEARLEVLEDQDKKIDALYTILGDFMEQTVKAWDAWDMEDRDARVARRSQAWEEYNALSCDEKWYSQRGKKLYAIATYEPLSDEQIHARNIEAVRSIVLDLYNRTEAIVGTANDWTGIHVTQGNGGFAVINGIIKGTDGTAKVESILAGGYNIQRLHIRTLVHAI